MDLKEGDLVRIVKQPPYVVVQVIGEVGILSEIKENYSIFDAIRRNGSVGGGGAVPLDCLVLEQSAEWLRAKDIYLANQAKILKEAEDRTARYKALLKETAEKYGVTQEAAIAIHSALSSHNY
jgi:shikimate kinase